MKDSVVSSGKKFVIKTWMKHNHWDLNLNQIVLVLSTHALLILLFVYWKWEVTLIDQFVQGCKHLSVMFKSQF